MGEVGAPATVALAVDVQPVAVSVAVTVYSPGDSPEMDDVVAPLDHKNVRPVVALVTRTEPSLPPHAGNAVSSGAAGALLRVCESAVMHVVGEESDMVTVYVPTLRPLMAVVVAPVLHAYV